MLMPVRGQHLEKVVGILRSVNTEKRKQTWKRFFKHHRHTVSLREIYVCVKEEKVRENTELRIEKTM